jgi:hypothetical protein
MFFFIDLTENVFSKIHSTDISNSNFLLRLFFLGGGGGGGGGVNGGNGPLHLGFICLDRTYQELGVGMLCII